MTMHRCKDLIRIRVPGGQLHRALLPGSLVVGLLVGLPGCIQHPGRTIGTVEIEVVPGETASGYLSSGQGLCATAFVEAGHVYHVSAGVSAATAGSTGPDEIVGVVSGDPLTEPVEFSVSSSWGGGSQGSQPPVMFVAYGDGEVVIEFAYASTDTADSTGSVLESIRDLVRGPMRATYELLITDLGFDDNGTSPDDAVTLPIGMDGERTGTITPADEADFFLLQVQADTTYQLNLESTDIVNVILGSEDRFGQVNFGVPTAGGLVIDVSSSAGSPDTGEFTAEATEEVLLRLTASGSGSSNVTIQYAISVVEVVPDGE